MAAPVYGKGFTGSMVHVPEATFGTLAATGQYAVPAVSEGITRNLQYISENEVLRQGNTAAKRHSLQGSEQSGGTIKYRFDYDNVKLLLAAAIGSGTGTPWVITPDAEVSGFTSVLIDKTVERLQCLGGVIEELRIMGDANADNGIIMIEADWVFQQRAASATAALTAALTTSTYAKMGELTFRIGDIVDVLAAGDALKISRFLLRWKNNLKLDYGSESAYIMQPIRRASRDVSLEFECPNYSDNTVQVAVRSALRSHTILQADMTWDGPGSDAILIQFPELFAAEPEASNIGGPESLTLPVKLNCYENVSNQTNMAAADNELLMTLTT